MIIPTSRHIAKHEKRAQGNPKFISDTQPENRRFDVARPKITPRD
jgi:hypothetical protein